jgi:hypothetical protein
LPPFFVGSPSSEKQTWKKILAPFEFMKVSENPKYTN